MSRNQLPNDVGLVIVGQKGTAPDAKFRNPFI